MMMLTKKEEEEKKKKKIKVMIKMMMIRDDLNDDYKNDNDHNDDNDQNCDNNKHEKIITNNRKLKRANQTKKKKKVNCYLFLPIISKSAYTSLSPWLFLILQKYLPTSDSFIESMLKLSLSEGRRTLILIISDILCSCNGKTTV